MEKFLGVLYLLLTVVNSKPPEISGATSASLSRQVFVSATVGEPRLNIFGYAPVNSTVYLNGIGISQQTQANKEGYFIFEKVYVPFSTGSTIPSDVYYPELCLFAIDIQKSLTSPVCIAPLYSSVFSLRTQDIISQNNTSATYLYEIGPVLVSPSLSLSLGKFAKGEQAKAYGVTTPNTQVEVFLAREKGSKSLFGFSLIKDAYAYFLPRPSVTSDSQGHYEFNLPNNDPEKWRIFTSAIVAGNNSPKSNTLAFSVASLISIPITSVFSLIDILRPFAMYIVILFQLIFILILLIVFRKLKERDQDKEEPKQKPVSRTHKKFKLLSKSEQYKKAQAEYLEILRKKEKLNY